jgi:hypothetical protein
LVKDRKSSFFVPTVDTRPGRHQDQVPEHDEAGNGFVSSRPHASGVKNPRAGAQRAAP